MSKELEQLKIMVAELGISDDDDLESASCAACCMQGGSGTNGTVKSPF